MSGTWGSNIKYTIFGESHGEGVGIVIDNLPSGLELRLEDISLEMKRRKPGNSHIATSREEKDEFEILSGVFKGRATGAPLCAFIRNTNPRSRDYEDFKALARPGHADFTSYIKYKGFNDYRGGGHFSGRMTAAIVFAGAIAKQILNSRGINIIAHIQKIGTVCDKSFMDEIDLSEDFSFLRSMSIPTIDSSISSAMEQTIVEVKNRRDSIGGVVETAILGLPAGLGSPFFDSLESTISHLVFSIPGIKGIEFGEGFALAEMLGSKANDSFFAEAGRVFTSTNHNGGILGGISSGMPLIFRAVFKPTPSIALEQNTVNMNTLENTKLKVEGRHDPCIVPRGLPVVEAAAAMAILEHLNLSN